MSYIDVPQVQWIDAGDRLEICANAFRTMYKLQMRVKSLDRVMYGKHNGEELIVALVRDPAVIGVFPKYFLGYRVVVDVI